MSDKKLYAVILAGGHGTRMGSKTPKQFLEIEGKPILRYTIEQFLSLGLPIEIIVVLPSESKEYWKQYCRQNAFLSRYIMPSSGITRFHSVQNALKYVPEGAIVAVHDGVRPFVSKEFLLSLFREAEKCEAVVPVIAPVESVREIDRATSESHPVNRDNYVLVQTPQVFHSELLLKAYSQPFSPLFTDDASVVEAMGYKVKLCQGSRANIKITTPEDLALAQAIFRLKREDNL